MQTFHRPIHTLVCVFAGLLPVFAYGQGQEASSIVRQIVKSELSADARDHSRWMFRDAETVQAKSTMKLVVQTVAGNISKTIEVNGHPPTPQEVQNDEHKMHQFVTSLSVRQKQRRDQQQDNEKATSLTKMLPDGFLWTQTAQSDVDATLAFKPNPKFNPPTREARVFAAMEGTMVVNMKQKRIKSLKGTLTQDVDFGFGVLGKLEKGGTFDVERQEIRPAVWEITAAHVHIHGHALIFKSISEEQDEETSHYKPTPQPLTLDKAAKMLSDGTVATELGISEPH